MLRYRDLTDIQKNLVSNGCGGKGGFINPPEFIFHASCNQHDFYYWRGGDEADRRKADYSFYHFMKVDITDEKSFLIRAKYRIIALTYLLAVRCFGRKYFNYGYKKTYEDVIRLTKDM